MKYISIQNCIIIIIINIVIIISSALFHVKSEHYMNIVIVINAIEFKSSWFRDTNMFRFYFWFHEYEFEY